jgi:hypothetical protein
MMYETWMDGQSSGDDSWLNYQSKVNELWMKGGWMTDERLMDDG